MYGYIYKTTDLETNIIYVGKKESSVFLGINYIGSGIIITRIKEKCIREGVPLEERFKVEMIDTGESRIELNEKEIYWINKLDARNPLVGYNLRKGGDCGPGGPMFKGHKHTEESKKKISRPGELNGNFGNRWHHTPDMKYGDLHGENNPMYGKKQSEEQKNKDAEAQTGVRFYSNKEKDIVLRFTKDDIVDEKKLFSEGYIRGNWHSHKEYKMLKKSNDYRNDN